MRTYEKTGLSVRAVDSEIEAGRIDLQVLSPNGSWITVAWYIAASTAEQVLGLTTPDEIGLRARFARLAEQDREIDLTR